MNIMRWRYVFLGFSAVMLLLSATLLATKGLQLGLDFTGGSLLAVELQQDAETTEGIASTVDEVYEVEQVQATGDNRYQLRGPEIDQNQKTAIITLLQQEYGGAEELRFESVGPTISGELVSKTFVAILIVAGVITLYVWHQFDEVRYGICAIAAMLHDSLIVTGSFALFGWLFGAEVDVLFVTAVLTTLSFSIHDTIVVYDRIRELSRKHSSLSLYEIVNTAVLETLNRSINNSVTIILVLFSLSLLGGSTIRWFATALLVGAITGTYSSTFTAAPLLLVWEEVKERRG